MEQFEYLEKYKYVTNVCLNLTDACNLACRYCFVEQHPHFMEYDTAKTAVDWLITNLRVSKEKGFRKHNEKINITFFGGEPMIMWDKIIVPLTEYIKTTYPQEIELNMTTNGTLLNEDRIKFLKENDISVLLSIDGAEQTQSYNRPCQNGDNSFDLVVKNIPALLEAFPQTTFRGTIIPDTVDQLFKNYIFAEYMGFKSIYFMPNNREVWDDDHYQILAEQLKLIYDYREVQFQNNCMPIKASFIDDAYTNILKRDIAVFNGIDEQPNIHRDVYRCGLGTGMGAIAYDGSIYGCQEQPSKDDKNIFLIGNIFNGGIDENLHKHLLETYWEKSQNVCMEENVCNNCILKQVCTKFACPSTSWDLFHQFNKISFTHCYWLNMLAEYASQTMNQLVNENNQLFKTYLDNYCNYKDYWKEE